MIVVDDGSTDRTAEIAREYSERFPGIVRLEQKENGGHGSAVNRGLEAATGTYFKVVDSDDWLDVSAYQKVLSTLRRIGRIDLLVTNYVYEYFYTGKRNVVRYRNIFPQETVVSWKSMGRFRISQLMLMHAMIYRTELLRECGLRLPEHTFYVDNLVAYLPLPYVKTLVYLDCDLYRYFIGRADQSVNTQVMIRRIDQQLTVTRLMIAAYDVFNDIYDKSLRRYMLHYLSMMVAISVLHINLAEDKSLGPKAEGLWNFIWRRDEKLYIALRLSFINLCINLTKLTGQRIAWQGLKLAKRIYKFS